MKGILHSSHPSPLRLPRTEIFLLDNQVLETHLVCMATACPVAAIGTSTGCRVATRRRPKCRLGRVRHHDRGRA